MDDTGAGDASPNEGLKLLALLGEETRRAVYFAVRDAEGALSRKDIANQVGITVGLATFHLEKLLEAGLLTAYYQRPPGRSGPGAGRSAKYYQTADVELAVSIPPRHYRRLSALLVEGATSAGEGEDFDRAVLRVAHQHGHDDGTRLRHAHQLRRPGRARILDLVTELLHEQGYEPYRADTTVALGNCPFRGLAQDAPELVCAINHAYLDGLVEGLGGGRVPAVLACRRPRDCCVLIGDLLEESR